MLNKFARIITRTIIHHKPNEILARLPAKTLVCTSDSVCPIISGSENR